jgi:hypothetical protein
MDINERIDSSGCGDVYRELEDCIAEFDRDWRRCQAEVLTLRKCMENIAGVPKTTIASKSSGGASKLLDPEGR